MNKKKFLKTFQKDNQLLFQGSQQEWWLRYIYHFSDISNIVKILNTGKLYSRNKAIELGLMKNDNANSNVISNTIEEYKNYARFYFRPKTPTQFTNEGIKPLSQINNNAHCPVPVFLLFDFIKIFLLDDIKFSSGNVASKGATIYGDIENLKNLEFNNIFHNSSLPQENYRKHITYCRQAEVLIKDELDISESLQLVVVRSYADKESLLFWLEPEARTFLKNKIKVDSRALFFHNWLALDRVEVQRNKILFHFEKNNSNSFYNIFLTAERLSDHYIINGECKNFNNTELNWDFHDNTLIEGIRLKIKIDNITIYENNIKFVEDDLI